MATDNLKGGVLAGQYLAKSLKQGATVAVLEGVPGVPALDDRVKGMEQGLGSSGIKVVGKAPTDCDQDKGVSAAADLLTAHPDVNAIYGACGPPTLGAIQSIQRAGRKPDGILLVGFDALPDEVKQIQAGKEDATVAQFPAKMGELGLGTLLQAVKGEKVAPTVDTGTAIVSKDNASDFYSAPPSPAAGRAPARPAACLGPSMGRWPTHSLPTMTGTTCRSTTLRASPHSTTPARPRSSPASPSATCAFRRRATATARMP